MKDAYKKKQEHWIHLFILKDVSQQGLKVIIATKCDDLEIGRFLWYENINTTFKNKIEIMNSIQFTTEDKIKLRE